MADVVRVISKTAVPSGRRVAAGRFARLAAQVLELKAGQALEIECAERKAGQHVKREVARILAAEGKALEWERSADGKHFFFWIEVTRG